MAVTRTVKQARASDLPDADDPNQVGFLSDGTDGYGKGEEISIPIERIFTVTKALRFDQLAYELQQATGESVYLASYQPPPGGDLLGPQPGSTEHPITVYAYCRDDSEDVTKQILTGLQDHKANPDWQDPALTG